MNLEDIGFAGLDALHKVIDTANKTVAKCTGKSLFDRMLEEEKQDAQLKRDKPVLWVTKHLTIGTVKGLLGASLHKDN